MLTSNVRIPKVTKLFLASSVCGSILLIFFLISDTLLADEDIWLVDASLLVLELVSDDWVLVTFAVAGVVLFVVVLTVLVVADTALLVVVFTALVVAVELPLFLI